MSQARRSDRPMTACRCATASRLATGPTINGMTRPILSVRLSWLLKGGSNVDTEQTQAGNGVWDRYWQEPFPRRWARRRRNADPEGDVSARYTLAVLRTRRAGSGGDGSLLRLAMVGTQDRRDTVRIIPAQFVKPYVKSN